MASTYQMPVDVVCEDGFVPECKHERGGVLPIVRCEGGSVSIEIRELSHAIEHAGKAFRRAHKSFQRMLPRGERIRYRNRQRALERSRRNNESRGRG